MTNPTPIIEALPGRTIDMAPTWGEVGLLLLRLALSGETGAIRHAGPEIARAFAMAEALSKLFPELTDEQRARAGEIIERESATTARAYS